MREIPLTCGQVALVDDADYERLAKHKWFARKDADRGWYAERKVWKPGPVRQQRVAMHREVLGVESGLHVDHRNGNGLDNRRENLRAATHSQNQANRMWSTRNTSGYKGVTLHRLTGKWQAAIKVNGRSFYLGLHETKEAAAAAYATAARQRFGEFAQTQMRAA